MCRRLHLAVITFGITLYISTVSSRDINIGALIPWNGSWPAGPRLASGLLIAIDKVNNDSNILKSHNLTYAWMDDMCEAGASLKGIAKLLQRNVDAFIGPACTVGCSPGGYLAEFYNLPMVSYGCGGTTLSDKKLYPTFSRTMGPYSQSGKFFVRIMERYGWKRVAILSASQSIWLEISSFVKTEVDNKVDFQVSYFQSFSETLASDAQVKSMLSSAEKVAHIFIFSGYGSAVRKIMLNAQELGMINKGYAFFTFELLPESCEGADGRNDVACEAFTGIIDLSQYIPETDEYKEFEAEVRRRMPEFENLNHNMKPTDEVSIYASFLHDSVLLYALALNDTLASGGNITDGRAVASHSFNRTFQGVTGTVAIDQSGDRMLSLQLRNIQNGIQKKYVRIADYFGITEKLEFRTGSTIVWPGPTSNVPLGRPECGFDNELCKNESDMLPALLSGIIVCVLILIIVLLCFYQRRKAFENALMSQQWKIDYSHIKFTKKIFGIDSSRSIKSLNSNKDNDNMSVATGATMAEEGKGQVFTEVGILQSRVVAVKRLRKTSAHVSRDVLMEFKEVRDLQHPNINRFVGACVESPNICIISQYCNKGSLQDVLLNDEMTLDWMFQMSFASDVARGMHALHNSRIQCHGSLCSSNCVIDSRWVCKITDHGLIKFKEGQSPDLEISPDNYFRKLMWTAPEHLEEFAARRSQTGDVYSYGIILQEILVRSLPYATYESMEAKDIIQRVRKGENPPFRPMLPKDSGKPQYTALIEWCWSEQPLERPKFSEILRSLKRMNNGKEINIMDNMISLMEKYTNHLEDVVRDRTRELQDEKAKTDALLYRMLPRSVADQLKRGEPVTAESFAQVTIFFSDIVGFTKLASSSTPMEVVDLLNDLYTCFDNILEDHDVYKVETIGDAYMVVSGLPKRNGIRHAGEIASMSLDLLSAMTSFKVRHREGYQLQLRVGIHSGPCVAGVVGMKMPRYCLFGDTVNYASRMESSGLALRIHVSPECRELLERLGGYHLQERGMTSMKGKGSIMTYFLNTKDGYTKQLPDLSLAASLEEHDFK